jgi:hypothetical protein
VIASLIAVAALSGCGNSRSLPPDVSQPRPPDGRTLAVHMPSAGVRFLVPATWRGANGAAPPLVASVVSGSATVAVWRYPRAETLPTAKKDLDQARKDLIASVEQRDPSAKVTKSEVTTLRGDNAILLLASERIAGHLRQVRSLHVFADKAEVVIDAYAPPAVFAGLDASVFGPLIRSLRITAPTAAKSP